MTSNPLIKKRVLRFKSIKRGYFSFLILIILIVLSCFLELWINNKALVVFYEDTFYFPVFSSKIYSGKEFGFDYEYEVNYRELQKRMKERSIKNENKNWIWMPLIPFNPYENDLSLEDSPPNPPSWKTSHYLGTDTSGRDILARLFYGFRIAIFFSFALYLSTTLIGVFFGSLMGYFGGKFDLFFQRIVEIWTSLPSLYFIIILAALITPTPFILFLIFTFLGWTGMTWLMRAEIYREKNRQYCEAARSMGASHIRILWKHLLPNSLVPIIATLPFAMVSGIGSLTGLDYLGYGLPIPTPSWGELLQQGQETFDYAKWILLSPSIATIFILLLFTFVGEAIRESFDPKEFSHYK